ncbi:MAG: SDR family oxidoreductase [Chitinophagaceae bacterium]
MTETPPIALITGASRGLGKAIATELAGKGYSLVLVARNEALLKQLADELALAHGSKSYIFSTDLKEPDAATKLFTFLKDNNVMIDTLINNAGIMQNATLMMTTEEIIDDQLAINLRTVLTMSRAAVKHFVRKRKGCIINMSSIVGVNGGIGQAVYSATKSALVGLTYTLSKELGPLGIRVNAIAPGYMMTDMTAQYDEAHNEKMRMNTSLRKLGSAVDVAKLASFLCSSDASFITGQVIGVDGGLLI